jgi:Domain of unknown function (DUF4194)
MSLHDYLESQLESSAVTLAEFQELLLRLLNYGVLMRDKSNVERDLYDRYVRVEELAGEALRLYGIEPYHDRRFEYVRLYPPGSSLPGMDQAVEQSFGGSLRARLSQHEVALALVLRAQYDKAVREGKLDEGGYATESFEAISLAMRNWLNRSLPDKTTERRAVFKRLKHLRLIDFREDEEVEQAESWVRIHPMIIDFVNADAIAALAPSDKAQIAQEPGNVS